MYSETHLQLCNRVHFRNLKSPKLERLFFHVSVKRDFRALNFEHTQVPGLPITNVPTTERTRCDRKDIFWAFVFGSRIAKHCALRQMSLWIHNPDRLLYNYISISVKFFPPPNLYFFTNSQLRKARASNKVQKKRQLLILLIHTGKLQAGFNMAREASITNFTK